MDMTKNIFDIDECTINDIFSREKRKFEYLDFDEDNLALVCSCLKTEMKLYQIYDILEQVGKKQIKFKGIINKDDQEQANKIRSHFKNKITNRRLKNQHISKWMKKTEAVLETPKTLREDHIGLLLKLPNFYDENKEREAIFKQYRSMKNPKDLDYTCTNLNSLVHFAGSVDRISKDQKKVTFYFSTEDKYLVAVDVNYSDMGYKLWSWFSQNHQPFRLKSNSVKITHHPGYDFFHMKLDHKYEIENE